MLRQSGELPGQYFLCYYKDQTCKTLKGQIDLDECEQVSFVKYMFLFHILRKKLQFILEMQIVSFHFTLVVFCCCNKCFSQVDTGLQFENKYQHMFDVRTPKRVYYLAAETEDEMMKWVHNVCHVCGLKAYTSDEDGVY